MDLKNVDSYVYFSNTDKKQTFSNNSIIISNAGYPEMPLTLFQRSYKQPSNLKS